MAIKSNLTINQGTTFSSEINVSDDNGNVMDLTGYTSEAQMRKFYTSNTSYDFAASIFLNDGVVELSMTANATLNIPAGRYVYDCNLISPSGEVTRLVEGIVTVTPGVTR